LRRIVLDTNVLVSALLSTKGNEFLALRLALSDAFEVGVTTAILKEYRDVLERPRFKISRLKIETLFSELEARARLVRPANAVEASPDEADNRFLECAETIDAEFLITGNKRHFPKTWKDTKVVNAREFLEQVVPL
jgi:putative PIN family toxin of toxin-antitoxin system